MATSEKILIVGSNSLTNSLICTSVQSHKDWKYSLIEVITSFGKARGELSVREYQAILIDCQSFELSPLEILIQIRGVSRNTPLIIINKPGMETTAINCLKYGADYYLIKEKDWETKIPSILDAVIEECRQKNKVKRRLATLEEENKRLRENSALDDSTNFYSSNHFNTILSNELKRANRYGFNLACLIMDVISSEKKSSGASIPSYSLHEQLALLLRSIVRSCDIWARLDDNRFAAILPHTTTSNAKKAIKRINSEISGFRFKTNGEEKPIKLSWGLANFNKNKIKDEAQFLKLAEPSSKTISPSTNIS